MALNCICNNVISVMAKAEMLSQLASAVSAGNGVTNPVANEIVWREAEA
jgi:hypothetical protein